MFRHSKWNQVATADVVSVMFLHHWEVKSSELYQTQGPPVVFKTVSAINFQMQPCNCVMVLDPNNFLYNKYPYFLAVADPNS